MSDSENPAEAMAFKEGGLEEKLEITSWVVLLLGAAVAVTVYFFWDSVPGWLAGLMVMLHTWVGWLMLQGLAELIRLQKKANGLPFSGKISRTRETRIRRCNACGELLHGDNFCGRCQRRVPDGD
jgi:hypothetical protein